jgi:hypothetical protein
VPFSFSFHFVCFCLVFDLFYFYVVFVRFSTGGNKKTPPSSWGEVRATGGKAIRP